MSDVIRAVKASWLPMPGRAADVRVSVPPDVYRFAQHQVEAQQREAQRSMARATRVASINSVPRAAPKPALSPSVAIDSVVLTFPLR